MEETVRSVNIHDPKYITDIKKVVTNKLKTVKRPSGELLECKQSYYDEVLQIYQEAFTSLGNKTITYANLLFGIKSAYDNAIKIRDERINQYITQDRVFGITTRRNEQQNRIDELLKEIDSLKEHNLELAKQLSGLKNDIGKRKDEEFSEYLALMKERDARYTLFYENVALRLKIEAWEGQVPCTEAGDPVLLRIALDRCREQLSVTQRELKMVTDEYADTVPRRQYDALESQHSEATRTVEELKTQYKVLEDKHKRLLALKKSIDEELSEMRDRCSELERAGTPRPEWELCAGFISGGARRWLELSGGRGSRGALRALLRELGPAAVTQHLEHFDGLGQDPAIPPYLQYEGRVRNLRLSRREIFVIINDIWIGKMENGQGMSMQSYVTKYFEDRYQQPSVRAEWAYNMCSGAEQMLDEPQVKLFWGVLHGHLNEEIYTAHRRNWYTLKDNLYNFMNSEIITVDEFEKVAKSTFPLKSEVEIKNMTDAAKKQLKMKMNNNEINLDKLFQENEEGFDRLELARELFREQQLAQDKYIREVMAALGGRKAVKSVSVDNLKRAFAIVDPAIDHIRMESNIRWVFSAPEADLGLLEPLPLRAVAARLAAGYTPRVGPRHKRALRKHAYK